MHIKSLLISACITFSLSAFSAPVELVEALRSKRVAIEAQSEGASGPASLRLTVTNLRDAIQLSIPAGWIFTAQDSTEQDLVVTRGMMVSLDKGAKRTVHLDAYCINAGKISPNTDAPYRSKGLAEGPLLGLARYIHHNKPESIQSAVWAVSDNHSLASIHDPGLVKFTAELLKMPVPEYRIRNGYSPEPGGPAYRFDPLSVEGNFEHRVETTKTVSFGLYNEAGVMVEPLFENKEWAPGRYRFEFEFRISGLEPGEYAVKLTDSRGADLWTKKVEW